MAAKKFFNIKKIDDFLCQRSEKGEKYLKGLSLENHDENNQQYELKIPPVSYFSLYSTFCERCGIAFAILLAILNGCVPPIVTILYGEFCNLLIDRQFPGNTSSTKTFLLEWFGGGKILYNASAEERRLALENDSAAWGIGCAVFTLIQFFFAMISVFLLDFTASLQVSRIQKIFFKSIICKDMTWYDTRMDGNFVGKAFGNLNQLQVGIGGVIGIFIYLLVIFVFGVIVAFIYGWKLTLAILSTAPISITTSLIIARIQSKLAAKEMKAYTLAAKVAEEVFGSVRTVVAFGGEKKEIERYSKHLEVVRVNSIRRGWVSGISGGILWLIIYSSYAIAFAYGVRLIEVSRENSDEIYTPAVLLIVFYGIFTGLTNIGFAASHLETFSIACGAATSVFHIIDTKARINPCSNDGEIGESCNGEIEFKNVYFEYPARPGVTILRGLNLKINPGEIVAIVGGSGSGKSTVLQLIQRFYDPLVGEIYLDGQNIKSLNVSWLRQQMGVVGQEPLLFATSIRENILYGNASATEADIIEAAKKANAHNFITREIEGYDTIIGQKGSTLSGGQKQRIAIARALIRNPKILLLDEATSALDSANERIVQAALERVAVGRTTLIVTHKLSTIANAHRIIVLANGTVAEEGTHAELFESKGLYYDLLKSYGETNKGSKKDDVKVSSTTLLTDDSSLVPSSPKIKYSTSSLFGILPKDSQSKISNAVYQYKNVTLRQILKWNKKELGFLITGMVASIIAGAALPSACILFGNLFGLLSLADFNEILTWTDIYSIIFVIISLFAGICIFLQMYCFGVSETSLITRLRLEAFKSVLRQEIGWFDQERNKVGALCLRLSRDPSGLQGATGSRLGIILQAFSTMTISTIVSFFFSWKMTLATLITIPFVFSGVYIESVFVKGAKFTLNRSIENASKIATEVIENIKVVASLNKEHHFIAKYEQALKEERQRNLKKAFFRGCAFAVGQTAPFFGYALSLWYGGYLTANENLHYKYVIMVSELLIFGAWTLGQCVVMAPSFREAKESAGRLQFLFTRKPDIKDGNLSTYPEMAENGVLSYSKVDFAYPTRPNTIVLQNFNAIIKEGKSIAIMGPSGSGKSTVIQLLLRYYDPTSGLIRINDVDISEYKLSNLRARLGLVSQEPVLFERTIEENIAYGDNTRTVSKNEVVESAQKANIHNFIMSLPQGYDTKLGMAGTQLSGGQKQRIAIARALVRNPQILLLDEATSALDPRSEIVVQEALDKATSGRSTIIVAHRLGAVRNADFIYVMEKGTVKESGTHEELMEEKGLYYSMYADDNKKEN